MTAYWHCLGLNLEPCPEEGIGEVVAMDRAAARHTKSTEHGTCVHGRHEEQP